MQRICGVNLMRREFLILLCIFPALLHCRYYIYEDYSGVDLAKEKDALEQAISNQKENGKQDSPEARDSQDPENQKDGPDNPEQVARPAPEGLTEAEIELLQKEDLEWPEGIKIAVIGFRGYNLVRTSDGEETYKEVHLDMSRRLIPEGPFVPIEDLPDLSPGKKPIMGPKVEAVLKSYLEHTGKPGWEELKLGFAPIQGRREVYGLRKTGADFYVVGIYQPFKEQRLSACLTGLSVLPHFLTLGLVPSLEYYGRYSKYHIFDQNLEFVGTFELFDHYKVLKGWFPGGDLELNEDGSLPLKLWQPHVQRFELQLKRLLYIAEANKKGD